MLDEFLQDGPERRGPCVSGGGATGGDGSLGAASLMEDFGQPADISRLLDMCGMAGGNAGGGIRLLGSGLGKVFRAMKAERIADLPASNPLFAPLKSLPAPLRKIIEKDSKDGESASVDFDLRGLMEPRERKIYAAYYTDAGGQKIMHCFLERMRAASQPTPLVLADPFAGIGETLVTAVDCLGPSAFRRVHATELYYPAALLCFGRLVERFGTPDQIDVQWGSAFRREGWTALFDKIDLILTNPPYTRWNLLSPAARGELGEFAARTGITTALLRKNAGLHIFSMFLIEKLLKPRGLLMAVVPASTFYTIEGKPIRDLVAAGFCVDSIIENTGGAAFSRDSDFKEVILVGRKRAAGDPEPATAFIDADAVGRYLAEPGAAACDWPQYHLSRLPPYAALNWYALFSRRPLAKPIFHLLEAAFARGTLIRGVELLGRKSFIRGFEIYGPDFFILPNKRWAIELRGERAEVRERKGSRSILLPAKHLIPCVSHIANARRAPSIRANEYCLAIPSFPLDDLDAGLREYIAEGIRNGSANIAIKTRGSFWYSHIFRALQGKKPFGNILIGDKFDLLFAEDRYLAAYAAEPLAASKNFYIIKLPEEKYAMALAGWLNSSLFLALALLFSRRIGRTWSRFLRNDYLLLPILPVLSMDPDLLLRIGVAAGNLFAAKSPPPLWKQMDWPERIELDREIFEAIGDKDPRAAGCLLRSAILDTVAGL